MTLAQYLDQHGMSQAAFAEAAGLSAASVSRYLAGTQAPTLAQMWRIFDATGGAVQPNDWPVPAQ